MSRGGPQGLGGALRASWVSLGPMGVSLGPMDIPGSHGCPWVPWVSVGPMGRLTDTLRVSRMFP